MRPALFSAGKAALTVADAISPRAKSIPASATIKISSVARASARKGIDVIDFGVGEPDTPAPAELRNSVAAFAAKGHKVYADVAGMPELIEMIRTKLETENKLEYATEQIMCFDGGKSALDRIVDTLVGPDDEVIIPTPAWVTYVPQVLLAGGTPVTVSCSMEQRFKITAKQLEEAITAKTKLLLLCPLGNPTGIAYTREELTALAEVLMRHPHVFIISDDLYEHLHFANDFVNILSVCPSLKDRTFIVNGTTKSHTWRFGYVAAPDKAIVNVMKNIQSHRNGHPNLETQVGALAALQMGPSPERRATFSERHDFLLPRLNAVPGWKAIHTDGGFYFFVDIKASMEALGIATDDEYCLRLLDEAHVAVTAGSGFSAPGHIRIAYSYPIARLEEALRRINNFANRNTPAPKP